MHSSVPATLHPCSDTSDTAQAVLGETPGEGEAATLDRTGWWWGWGGVGQRAATSQATDASEALCLIPRMQAHSVPYSQMFTTMKKKAFELFDMGDRTVSSPSYPKLPSF